MPSAYTSSQRLSETSLQVDILIKIAKEEKDAISGDLSQRGAPEGGRVLVTKGNPLRSGQRHAVPLRTFLPFYLKNMLLNLLGWHW